MRMPNGELAVVTDEKLFGFLVNAAHDEQSGHAVLFARLLGIDTGNAELLRKALLDAAATGDATLGKPSASSALDFRHPLARSPMLSVSSYLGDTPWLRDEQRSSIG